MTFMRSNGVWVDAVLGVVSAVTGVAVWWRILGGFRKGEFFA